MEERGTAMECEVDWGRLLHHRRSGNPLLLRGRTFWLDVCQKNAGKKILGRTPSSLGGCG